VLRCVTCVAVTSLSGFRAVRETVQVPRWSHAPSPCCLPMHYRATLQQALAITVTPINFFCIVVIFRITLL
jgi:hypothetical protein